jgi:hypothetical protein
MTSDPFLLPPFTASYAPDDGALAARLLETARLDAAQDQRVDRTATRLIDAIRASDDRLGGVEDMLREFALSTKEGLALMVLAEALLRVPDARTADQFIEDKLALRGHARCSACPANRQDRSRHTTSRCPTKAVAGELRSSDRARTPPTPGRAWR